MMRALGFVISLYAVSVMLSDAFNSFEAAVAATFNTVEVAAVASKHHIMEFTH